MKKQEKKINQILKIIIEHVTLNLKQYIIISTIFLIGIILGVILVNNAQDETKMQIGKNITTFIYKLKFECEIDYSSLLKNVIINHIIFIFIIWFMGCTVIGIPIVYAMIAFKGFSLGYTISLIIYILGFQKGIAFCTITLLLQNILIIPAILSIAVSGMNLYKAIMKDKRKENIKIEIIKHTIFSLAILLVLLIASCLEVYGSNMLLSLCIRYF